MSLTRASLLLTPALVLVSTASSAAPQSGGVTPIPGLPRQAPPAPSLVPGQEAEKPGGGTFIVDPNQEGAASELHLLELVWGRLVDVHGLDGSGSYETRPRFRDFVVNEDVQSDGVDFLLAPSYATQGTRLLILREPGAPEPFPGAGTFEELLAQAAANLPPIVPKGENGFPPFSLLPRNAVLMARFDDLLRDSDQADQDLFENVRLFTGYPPRTPFGARVLFDPNHGGIARGRFHSTRVLIDLTFSPFELSESVVPSDVNLVGAPASLTGNPLPSITLRIPTQVDFGSGQFTILVNLRNRGLSVTGNGPVDFGSPTLDVVRAMRSGNEQDPNAGFLLDRVRPELLGSFPATVLDATPTPGGEVGFEFLLDWRFTIPCAARPVVGSFVAVGSRLLEVLANAGPLTPDGEALDVSVRVAGSQPVTPGQLLGQAAFLAPMRHGLVIDPACWIGFLPQPGTPPSALVSPSAQVLARFSEPMDPASLRPFDTLRLVRGDPSVPADATSIVVAETLTDGIDFALSPLLPLAHAQGTPTPYHLELIGGPEGALDLAGNPLASGLVAPFTLDPLAASESNGSVVLRFASQDELPTVGAPDLRGQVFFDLAEQVLLPRPPAFTDYPADRSNPVPSIMIPFAPGVQSPLAPLGSKLHAVWRYCDVGWSVYDETKYNLDVAGLNWSPVGGQVINDFFDRFEIRLSHAARLPDEAIDQNLLPKYPNSGLVGAPQPFTDNILDDPLSPQKVVHPRGLGYTVSAADLFHSATGTPLLPFPLNEDSGPLVTYTWRDTAVLSQDGPYGAGVPLDVEVGPPLFLEPEAGALAPSGQVPSIGLPLLMEFRCYPTDLGIGLNALDVSLAINSSALPAFRSYSTGGIGVNGVPVVKDPDLEVFPDGGLNPYSNPPGLPTELTADDTFHIGQLDVVTRVSRAHTVWIDTGASAPDYFEPVVEKSVPDASSVSIDFRGATGFSGGARPFEADRLDAYGEVDAGSVTFFDGLATWTDDIDDLDGARYVQMRFSLVNDLATLRSPVLAGLGIAFQQ